MGRSGKNPCFTCRDVDCASCVTGPENSVPVKLYTPKGAARAMLAGKILKGEGGITGARWDKTAFVYQKNGGYFFMTDFSGLYSEGAF
jgi:hypothetical protein